MIKRQKEDDCIELPICTNALHQLLVLRLALLASMLHLSLQILHLLALFPMSVFRTIPMGLLAVAVAVAERLAPTTLLAHVALQCSAASATFVANSPQISSYRRKKSNEPFRVLTAWQNASKIFYSHG